MKTLQQSLPSKISEYIKSHFREDFLFKYKNMHKVGNKKCHAIEIAKDEHIYHLYFDQNGMLVKKRVEEAFPEEKRQDHRLSY